MNIESFKKEGESMEERFDKRFEVKIGLHHLDENKECFPCEGGYCQMNPIEIKSFIKEEINQALELQREEDIEAIKKIKEAVRTQTGSFKYDDCYDDCIRTLNSRNGDKEIG